MSKKIISKYQSTQNFLENVIARYQKERKEQESSNQAMSDSSSSRSDILPASESASMILTKRSLQIQDMKRNNEKVQGQNPNVRGKKTNSKLKLSNSSYENNKEDSTSYRGTVSVERNEISIFSNDANLTEKLNKLDNGNFSSYQGVEFHQCYIKPNLEATKIDPRVMKTNDEGILENMLKSTIRCDEEVSAKSHEIKNSFFFLALPSDQNFLPPFQCFTRKYLFEIFVASARDIDQLSNRRKIHVGQVGIRCPRCANLPVEARALRYSCFPRNISRIYQNVEEFRKHHFGKCTEIPIRIRDEYNRLLGKEEEFFPSTTSVTKILKRRTKTESKYWIESAKSLGLVDTDNGIFLRLTDRVEVKSELSCKAT